MAMPDGSPLPPDVLEALGRRNAIEAVKRLRAATGLGLKEALAVVEAHLSGQPVRPPPSASAAPTSVPPASVPPAVLAALHQGHKIEAIRLLREHSGLGLKEAKDVVDALPQPAASAQGHNGLAPGEMPRSGSVLLWVVLALLGAALAYWLLRGG